MLILWWISTKTSVCLEVGRDVCREEGEGACL